MPGNKDINKKREIVRESQRKRRARLGSASDRHLDKQWRLNRKKELVDYKGGKCTRCGYTPSSEIEYNVLEFHHVDPSAKLFNVGTSLSRSMESLLLEADKCMLLCANCHRIIEM